MLELLREELEALSYTFKYVLPYSAISKLYYACWSHSNHDTCSEDELNVVREDPLELAVQISPYTGEDTRQQYVHACLVLRTGPQYPSEPAAVELHDVKGAGCSLQEASITIQVKMGMI